MATVQARASAARLLLAAGGVLALAACSGPQSALDPMSGGARQVALLFWIMLTAAAVIWLAVIGLAVYASRIAPERHSKRLAHGLILFGGVIAPTLLLAALLSYGLSMMRDLTAPGDGLVVEVSGEQWWWRVHYRRPGDEGVVASANEIRMPAGQRVEFRLSSPDVIHSFWIPPLGGKVDMIPGRETKLVLDADAPGVVRGVCAEFCGPSHALMAFNVVVMEPAAFEVWIANEARPAQPAEEVAQGREAFLANGCGACHTVRGTQARGAVGPDLTHVGGRTSLAAGILPNTSEAMARWIARAQEVKPGSRMPSFHVLGEEQIAAISAYLVSLK